MLIQAFKALFTKGWRCQLLLPLPRCLALPPPYTYILRRLADSTRTPMGALTPTMRRPMTWRLDETMPLLSQLAPHPDPSMMAKAQICTEHWEALQSKLLVVFKK